MDQHGSTIHLGIPEQLDDWWNPWWKGNFLRSGRTSASKGSSFILDWFHGSTVPHPNCASKPSKPAKIIPRSKNYRTWYSLSLKVQWTGHFQLQWRSEASWQDRVQSDFTWFAKLGAVTVENLRVERFRFGQDDFSPKCTKSCALTRACPPVDLSTFKRSLLEM